MVISLWPLVVCVCVRVSFSKYEKLAARLIQGNSLSELLIAPSERERKRESEREREREREREILSQKLRVQDWIGFMIIKYRLQDLNLRNDYMAVTCTIGFSGDYYR